MLISGPLQAIGGNRVASFEGVAKAERRLCVLARRYAIDKEQKLKILLNAVPKWHFMRPT